MEKGRQDLLWTCSSNDRFSEKVAKRGIVSIEVLQNLFVPQVLRYKKAPTNMDSIQSTNLKIYPTGSWSGRFATEYVKDSGHGNHREEYFDVFSFGPTLSVWDCAKFVCILEVWKWGMKYVVAFPNFYLHWQSKFLT